MRDLQGEWLALPRSAKGIPAPAFGTQFWKSLTKLQQEFKTAQTSDKRPAHIDEPEEEVDVRYVEPISILVAQHVPNKQICKMYRAPWPADATDGPGLWNNSTDQPMIARLLKEIKEPGSVLGENADEWPDADCHEQAQRLQRQRELAERILAAADARRAQEISKLKERRQAGPDEADLGELVAQGVGGVQIARMKKTTVEEIERQCREQEIPVPPRRYSPSLEIDPNLPQDIKEARQRTGAAVFTAFQDRGSQRQAETTTATSSVTATATAEPGTDEQQADDFGGEPDDMDGSGTAPDNGD